MRSSPTILVAAMALLSWSAALGIEHGLMVCAGDLSSEPFVDTAKLGPLASNQPVTIVERKDGWLGVHVGGGRGSA